MIELVCNFCHESFSRAKRQPFCSRECGYLFRKKPLHKRFLDQVEPTNGCWWWRGGVGSCGYGQIKDAGLTKRTHRVSWNLFHGHIPDEMLVCHTCDNTLCVNPAHLFLGSHFENQHDCIRKGRKTYARGESIPSHKLTPSDVSEIRKAYSSGEYSQAELGRKYGVAQPTIFRIVHRDYWAHVIGG